MKSTILNRFVHKVVDLKINLGWGVEVHISLSNFEIRGRNKLFVIAKNTVSSLQKGKQCYCILKGHEKGLI